MYRSDLTRAERHADWARRIAELYSDKKPAAAQARAAQDGEKGMQELGEKLYPRTTAVSNNAGKGDPLYGMDEGRDNHIELANRLSPKEIKLMLRMSRDKSIQDMLNRDGSKAEYALTNGYRKDPYSGYVDPDKWKKLDVSRKPAQRRKRPRNSQYRSLRDDGKASKAKTPKQMLGTDRFEGKYTDAIRKTGYDYDSDYAQARERSEGRNQQRKPVVLNSNPDNSSFNSRLESVSSLLPKGWNKRVSATNGFEREFTPEQIEKMSGKPVKLVLKPVASTRNRIGDDFDTLGDDFDTLAAQRNQDTKQVLSALANAADKAGMNIRDFMRTQWALRTVMGDKWVNDRLARGESAGAILDRAENEYLKLKRGK